jgi:alkanesulfonate monooxygenase SsuD/methylene tetrahydromethanopterin reductase-like flavin-dependent oxidoreductase (luciferase family)
MKGARRQEFTLRQAVLQYATSDMCPQVVGTPDEVADQLEGYFASNGCDGFIVTPTQMPGSFETFCRAVIPILKRRNLVPHQRTPGTFRDQLRQSAGMAAAR